MMAWRRLQTGTTLVVLLLLASTAGAEEAFP
jgi:hypothetical protein